MDRLQITKDNAVKAYNNGDTNIKKVLENLLGADTFRSKNIMDRVKSYADAVIVLGRKAIIVSTDTDDEVAYKELKLIAEALNEGWKPNWDDHNECKYYPWFNMSSSGLSDGDFGCSCSGSGVGSRLCFKSEELAKYAGKQFIDLYTKLFIIK
jgi:hypothetical protein